ncbi:MAG TPA: GYD domain-containing protein [Vicinamibacterales bacterium]|nr:GYD domain-containing protein [Vicinamibacterales bacterium]
MPHYLYELSYTPESVAAQIKNPQDRIEAAAKPVAAAVGGKILGGGYAFGEHDLVLLMEAPDDESAAAVALAVAAGGTVRSARTTKLLSGSQWVSALQKASGVAAKYKPAK